VSTRQKHAASKDESAARKLDGIVEHGLLTCDRNSNSNIIEPILSEVIEWNPMDWKMEFYETNISTLLRTYCN